MKEPFESLRGKLTIKHGFPFKGEYFENSGYFIVLTPGNFIEKGGFKRDSGKEKYYSGEIPQDYLHEKGDLIIAMTEQAKGLLGSTAIVPESGIYLHNQRLGLVEPIEGETDKLFLYYFFNWPFIREQIALTSTGSKVKHTSPQRLYNVLARLPELCDQKIIGKVLSDLDSKIELNNRINAELESMAKLIYDYWFVQFDFPISAAQVAVMGRPELEGKPYKSSGGKMVWNGELKREVPEGWARGELNDIAKITMGQSPPGESYNEDSEGEVFYQGCTDFGPRFPTARKYTTQPSRFAKAGDILLSVRAPVGTMNIANEDCCIGRGLAALKSKNGSDAYLYEVLKYFKQIFDRRNTDGTTFGAITKNDLFSLSLVIPPPKLISAYENAVGAAFKKLNVIEAESRELAGLRDWLLPMLMNGQVKVKEEEMRMAAEPEGEYARQNSKKS